MATSFKFFSILCIILVLTSFKTDKTKSSSTPQQGDYKVAILYPNGEGKTFNMDYYERWHMPMVAGFLGKNLKHYEIDKGIAGRTPNDKPPFLAIGYFYVSDIGEYNKAIMQNRDTIIADFKNYTNVQPVVQISETKQIVVVKPGTNSQ